MSNHQTDARGAGPQADRGDTGAGAEARNPPSADYTLVAILDVLRSIDARLARAETAGTELAEQARPLLGAVANLRPIRKAL